MTSFRDNPIHPTKTELRDKRIWEIVGVMQAFELERQKAEALGGTIPERWRKGAEAAAIYALFVPND